MKQENYNGIDMEEKGPNQNLFHSQAKVAIIIINYNNNEDTLSCLLSLRHTLNDSHYKFDIYLVDNGSRKPIPPIEILGIKLPICYFQLKQNIGFTGGNNFAIKEAHKKGYDYYALINNDTVFIDNSIFYMIESMERYPDFGIGGMVNYYYSSPNKIWQAGSKLNKFFFRFKSIRHVDKSISTFVETDSVPGSSIFIRNNVIESIGLLDDNYFAYYEESDYCKRAKNAGFKVGYLPQTVILHKVGKSSTSLFKQYLRDRNHLYFCNLYGNYWHKMVTYIQIVFIAFLYCISKGMNINYLANVCHSISDYRHKRMGNPQNVKIKNS